MIITLFNIIIYSKLYIYYYIYNSPVNETWLFNKVKSLVSNAIVLLLLILIFILLFLSINIEPSGYYKEKTYDDGTGIHYEWIGEN